MSKVTTAPPQDDPASFQLRFRGAKVREHPFAGRIGGNQEFCLDPDDEAVKQQPDAAPIISISRSLDPSGFLVFEYYKMGLIEGLGTCLLVFVSGAGANALTTLGDSVSPMAIALYAALFNWISLTLFVYTTAPASGGHLNPSITMGTFFAGLSSLPRSLIYVVSQSVGAIVGGYWLRLGLGKNGYFPSGVIPGCTVDEQLVSRGQLFVLEYVFALAQLFLAFGVGLEPRNAKTYGPAFAPVLVGLTLGLGTLASSFVKEGYSGISFNSARCLGLMTAKGNLQYNYLHWIATLSACMVHGVFYHTVPPYKKSSGKARREALPCVEHHAGSQKH
ncbi:Aquaporin PIP 1-3 [Pseudocercospora fuligena]|uniref:Aquaporin PIP 1-3 n=1 Tax=Pseudocercospora fuligena TaxID=685502 RepID=A0A8H6R9U4_9PEZI|nr:Aquaporin PIP 1-3 [Pseudocercospora fuligena]